MSTMLACCHQGQPYLGIDPDCPKPSVICLVHSSHPSQNGTIHNLLPLPHFKQTINDLKFAMADKASCLTEQYTKFMDELISQIQSLKMRKVIQMGTLWLRELASSEQEYEELKRMLRFDFEGFSCRDIHRLYKKLTSKSQGLKEHNIRDLSAYANISKILEVLDKNVKAKLLIRQKITSLEGMLEKGELLKRALPERRILNESTKQILMQTSASSFFELRYNKAELKQSSKKYLSLFSKYELLKNTDYHLTCYSKYTNLLIGICTSSLKTENSSQDLHYNDQSITFNCSSGCVYRDGMFESGKSTVTKGRKELDLILRVTKSQMLIMMGRNVISRVQLRGVEKKKLYLHVLMRTLGDWIEIGREEGENFDGNEEQGSISRSDKQSEAVLMASGESSASFQGVRGVPQLQPEDNMINQQPSLQDSEVLSVTDMTPQHLYPSDKVIESSIDQNIRTGNFYPQGKNESIRNIGLQSNQKEMKSIDYPNTIVERESYAVQRLDDKEPEVLLRKASSKEVIGQFNQRFKCHQGRIQGLEASGSIRQSQSKGSLLQKRTQGMHMAQLKQSLYEPTPGFNTGQFNDPSSSIGTPFGINSPVLQRHKSNELHLRVQTNMPSKSSYLMPSDPASNPTSNGISQRDQRSKIMISMRSSMLGSELNDIRSSDASNNGKLLSPAIITPMKRSQLDSEIRSVNYGNDLPSMRLMKKKVSGLTVKGKEEDGLRKTEQFSEWL